MLPPLTLLTLPPGVVHTTAGTHSQCLYSNGGYTWLDVRSALEVQEVGKVSVSVCGGSRIQPTSDACHGLIALLCARCGCQL
jgi:hypothetical protein